jgi:hypothetical protein
VLRANPWSTYGTTAGNGDLSSGRVIPPPGTQSSRASWRMDGSGHEESAAKWAALAAPKRPTLEGEGPKAC